MKSNLPSNEFIEMLDHLISENQKVLKEIKIKSSKKEEGEFADWKIQSGPPKQVKRRDS